MPFQIVPRPLINGVDYDFSSIEFMVPGYPPTPPYGGILEVSAIDYDDDLEAGELRGAAPNVLGRSRGKYTAGGKVEMAKLAADNLLEVIQAFGMAQPRPMGYLEYGGLLVTVNYFEPSIDALVTDQLVGFRLKKPSDSHKTGQ